MNPCRQIVLAQIVLALFVSALFGVPTAAVGQNLVVNSTFAVDTVPWETPTGVLRHTASDGFQGAGAGEVEGVLVDPVFGNSVGIRQCVDLTGVDLAPARVVQAAVHPVSHAPFLVSVLISYLEDDACLLGSVGDAPPVSGVVSQGQWAVVQGPIPPVPAGAGSMRVSVVVATAATASDTLTRFDDVRVDVDPVFFVDGFESGDTSGW